MPGCHKAWALLSTNRAAWDSAHLPCPEARSHLQEFSAPPCTHTNLSFFKSSLSKSWKRIADEDSASFFTPGSCARTSKTQLRVLAWTDRARQPGGAVPACTFIHAYKTQDTDLGDWSTRFNCWLNRWSAPTSFSSALFIHTLLYLCSRRIGEGTKDDPSLAKDTNWAISLGCCHL